MCHCIFVRINTHVYLNTMPCFIARHKAMSKMSKIDKVHIRGVRLCISKMSKMGKEHTHTFWLITSLILNGFSIRKSFGKLRLRAFQPYHQILCILKHVGDVRDRSSTPKGCNAIYVRDVRDRNNLQYTQCLMLRLKIFTISDISDINSITALRCT